MIICGTYSGSNAHHRAGTALCPECREAASIYMRTLRKRRDLGAPLKGATEAPYWKTRPELVDMAQVGPVLEAGLRASA